MEYFEFHVKVEGGEVSVSRDGGPPIRGEVDFDNDPLRQRTLRMFNRWLEAQKFQSREDLALVGTYLYRVLFSQKNVHEAFGKAFAIVNERKQSGLEVALRVVLEFAGDAAELAALPWEYLYFPPKAEGGTGAGFFIAGDSMLILSRHVPQNPLIKCQPQETELRILVLVSKPNYEMLDSGELPKTKRPAPLGSVESDRVIGVLRDLEKRSAGRVRLEIEAADVSKERVAALVREIRPHVVHFMGHGKFEAGAGAQEGKGALAFIRREQSYEAVEQRVKGREAAWVDDAAFADCFRDYRPRLIFLQACQGARSDSYEAFSGVAMKLVQESVPAVIAMRYPVSNSMAEMFAATFYAQLASGCAIDQAVQLGRLQLGTGTDEEKNFSSPEFGSPVAFFQGGGQQKSFDEILAPGRIPSSSPPPPVAAQQIVRCPYADCLNPVNPQRRFCQKCKRPISPCPNCQQLMAVDTGFCDNCGWRPDTGAAAAPSAAPGATAPAPPAATSVPASGR